MEKLRTIWEADTARVLAVSTTGFATLMSNLDLILKVVIGLMTVVYLMKKLAERGEKCPLRSNCKIMKKLEDKL